MKILLGLLLMLMPCLPAATPASGDATIEEAAVSFQIRNAGITVEGSFEGLEADIAFDPLHPEKARIQASLPVSSIRTGIGLRDKHLQKPDYFHAEKHPRILLTSKSVRQTGKGKYEGVFTLRIKDIEREVLLPFTVAGAHAFVGSLKVNRLHFDLGKQSLVLADEVEVAIRVKLKPVPQSPTESNDSK
jgi:polyisoprenoid-binding protein YceI